MLNKYIPKFIYLTCFFKAIIPHLLWRWFFFD